MSELFGVFPAGEEAPAAVFRELRDAVEWGLQSCGIDGFVVRRCWMELPQVRRPAA